MIEYRVEEGWLGRRGEEGGGITKAASHFLASFLLVSNEKYHCLSPFVIRFAVCLLASIVNFYCLYFICILYVVLCCLSFFSYCHVDSNNMCIKCVFSYFLYKFLFSLCACNAVHFHVSPFFLCSFLFITYVHLCFLCLFTNAKTTL